MPGLLTPGVMYLIVNLAGVPDLYVLEIFTMQYGDRKSTVRRVVSGLFVAALVTIGGLHYFRVTNNGEQESVDVTKNFPADEITEIRIKSRLSQVSVVAGNGDDIMLYWTDTGRRTTTATQDGEALEVEDKGEIGFYDVLGFIQLKEDRELVLEIPASFTGSLEIEARDEPVQVFGVGGLGSLSVKTTIGAIEITTMDALDYQLSSKGGNISLHGVSCGSGISADTNNGNIDCLFVGDEMQYLLDCHTDRGTLDIPRTTYNGEIPLRLRTVSGKISVQFTNRVGE